MTEPLLQNTYVDSNLKKDEVLYVIQVESTNIEGTKRTSNTSISSRQTGSEKWNREM